MRLAAMMCQAYGDPPKARQARFGEPLLRLGKQKQNFCQPKVLLLLVETAGFEPATSCMSSMHSNQLSYASATLYIITYENRKCNPFFKKSLSFGKTNIKSTRFEHKKHPACVLTHAGCSFLSCIILNDRDQLTPGIDDDPFFQCLAILLRQGVNVYL